VSEVAILCQELLMPSKVANKNTSCAFYPSYPRSLHSRCIYYTSFLLIPISLWLFSPCSNFLAFPHISHLVLFAHDDFPKHQPLNLRCNHRSVKTRPESSAEYLRSITVASLPLGALQLRIGAPLMLTRNLDPQHGLCNGTRAIIAWTSVSMEVSSMAKENSSSRSPEGQNLYHFGVLLSGPSSGQAI
jgi:PIF1-like helicase